MAILNVKIKFNINRFGVKIESLSVTYDFYELIVYE